VEIFRRATTYEIPGHLLGMGDGDDGYGVDANCEIENVGKYIDDGGPATEPANWKL
jgi:hypothetical protein